MAPAAGRTCDARADGYAPGVADTAIFDVSAGEVDVPTLAVRTGGFAVEELREAGAAHVFESLQELRDGIDDTPLARPSR